MRYVLTPLPRRLNRPRSDPTLGILRRLLGADVVGGVATIGHGPALTHQLLFDVLTANVAAHDKPAVAVGVDRLAADRRLNDKVSQRQRALLPAAPRGAIREEAWPALFRSVDPMELHPLAVNLYGVSVDDGGAAGDGIGTSH